MSAQNRTLDQYHELMQINAVSHLLRAARQVGLLDALIDGQRTASQLCERLSLLPEPTHLLLDALVAIGILEQYGDDYALSAAAQLLCQYDDDLGDQHWQRVADSVQATDWRASNRDQPHFDYLAATQWIHTPAAIQAAEILDIGGEAQTAGVNILDLGCGSAVWSCAMAHRDRQAKVTAVDHPGSIEAARATAASIDILDRFVAIEGNPYRASLPGGFDLVLLAQRLHASGGDAGDLLKRAAAATKSGGRVVVIDLFRGPAKPSLAECVEALKLHLNTQQGHVPRIESTSELMAKSGLQQIQFSFLAASRVNLGLMVGVKPT